MNVAMATSALVTALLSGVALAQPVYRWIDANGRIHYSTERPPGVAASVVQPRVSSYSGAPAVSGAPAPARPGTRAEVVMYSTDWCPYCRKAREYFARHGIAYRELDIEKSAEAHAQYQRLGGRGVPLIVVGSQRMSGFGEDSLARLLKSAGY